MTQPDLATIVGAVEDALASHLPQTSAIAPHLVEALRYSTLGAGKRLRPALVCATATGLGADLAVALSPAVAVEFIHAYSLVHDDLPAMDDDDLRRGRATCHIAFDEATAILTGDALQTLAFETLAKAPDVGADARLEMIELLADAAGWRNMVGGQALDMKSEGQHVEIEVLERLHAAKTGAMFRVSVQLGSIAAGHRKGDETFAALTSFADDIGLAFQVVDDILDVTQTTEMLGKPAGSDARANKSTYPALLGLNAARAKAGDLLARAQATLAKIGLSESTLAKIATNAVERVS